MFKLVNNDSCVVSFDPSPIAFDRLKFNNINNNFKDWIIENIAVGEKDDNINMHYEWDK
jgi:FkbM family methyltransferase